MRACHAFCLNASRCAMIQILRLSLIGPYHLLVNKIPRGASCNGRDFGALSPRLRLHDAEGCKSSSSISSWPTFQNAGRARGNSQLDSGTDDLKQRLHMVEHPFPTIEASNVLVASARHPNAFANHTDRTAALLWGTTTWIPCPWLRRLIVGKHTATAVGSPALFVLLVHFHYVYRARFRSTRGRLQIIGAALTVGGHIAAGHHRNCGLGRGARARLGNRGERARATKLRQ